MVSTVSGKTQTSNAVPGDSPSAATRPTYLQDESPVSNNSSVNSPDGPHPEADASVSIRLNRLINASRQAAQTTRLANGLASDPDFKAWLKQLAELHESSAIELERVLEAEGFEYHKRFNLRSWLRRSLILLTPLLSETADFALIEVCRHEEFRVQSAYELALWTLPAGDIRETVEDLFQQFVLHRSMIPTRRLPQTQQFLLQADRLQRIHSSNGNEVVDSESVSQERTRRASPR